MDFTSMNFGDLLFALNCDPIKNEIWKIEKMNKLVVQTKNGIYFINIYIYEIVMSVWSTSINNI